MVDIIPHWIDGRLRIETASSSFPVYNPALGEPVAKVHCATDALCDEAVKSAAVAFDGWSQLPPVKRSHVIFKFRDILQKNQLDLARIVTKEHGKTLDDAKGSIARAVEVVELYCGILAQLQGSFSMNVSAQMDCLTVREPLGVCLGVSPFNFPVMVPVWMMMPAIACGNTFILKPSEQVPSAPLRLLEYFDDAGLPAGVVNLVHGDKQTVNRLIEHPLVRAVTAVGSTPVAESIYKKATELGKRSHTFGGAKNHAVVMRDANIEQTAEALVGAAFGSAGERCMAISVVVTVGDDVATRLLEALVPRIQAIQVDAGDAAKVDMGPLISRAHHARVLNAIDTGVAEGATLVVDGRQLSLPAYPQGYFIGPSFFDHVTEEMSVYQQEIFGPVLVMVRVSTFDEAIAFVNRHQYGNGTALFTSDGYCAREYARRIQVGMVGVNVAIPVPVASHPFGGWKRSSFGDNFMQGAESIHFYTRLKTITTKWPRVNEHAQDAFIMPTH